MGFVDRFVLRAGDTYVVLRLGVPLGPSPVTPSSRSGPDVFPD